MNAALRRAILLAALVTPTCGAARAETACAQLFPIGLVAPEGGFEPGCASRYVLRRGAGAGGCYVWLEYPPCANGPCVGLTGAPKYVCEATNGYFCCIGVAQLVPLVAGNYTGPWRLGLDQRIANDSDPRAGICHSDYAGNGSRLGDVPVIQPIGIGQVHAEVAGFLRMFISAPAAGNGDIMVEFVAGPTPAWSGSWGGTKIRYR